MGIVFAWRSDNGYVARYSAGGATAFSIGGIVTAADAGAIGGSCLAATASNAIKGFYWPGRFNTPDNRTMAVLVRLAPGYGGTPASVQQIFSMGSGGSRGPAVDIAHATTGNLNIFVRNENATVALNSTAFGSYSAASASYTDYFFNYSGQTGASAAISYINGTVFGVCNATQPLSATWNATIINEIMVGLSGVVNAGSNGTKFNEIVIWNQSIDVTAVPLDDGTTAALSGPTRTAFVTAPAFDGMAWTTLAQTNVKNAIVYTAAGVGFTGSYTPVNTTTTITAGQGLGDIQLG